MVAIRSPTVLPEVSSNTGRFILHCASSLFFSSTARIESTPSDDSDWSAFTPSTPSTADRSPFTRSPIAWRRSVGGSCSICVISASACTDDDASDHFMESKIGWSPNCFRPVSNGNTMIW